MDRTGISRNSCIERLGNDVAQAVAAPPLGLIPSYVFEFNSIQCRINDILAAMDRYAAVSKPIPSGWIVELRKRIQEERDFEYTRDSGEEK